MVEFKSCIFILANCSDLIFQTQSLKFSIFDQTSMLTAKKKVGVKQNRAKIYSRKNIVTCEKLGHFSLIIFFLLVDFPQIYFPISHFSVTKFPSQKQKTFSNLFSNCGSDLTFAMDTFNRNGFSIFNLKSVFGRTYARHGVWSKLTINSLGIWW